MSSFVHVDAFSVTEERLIGRVKWFNNKAGYGFITVTDGPRSGTDVFVHHTSILLKNRTYRSLEQGEYVEFTFSSNQHGDHQYSAKNVTGVKNGSLMCESKNKVVSSRFATFMNDSQEIIYEPSNYTKRMDEYRPPEIFILPEKEFREWNKKVPMAPKARDVNTF